MNPNSFRGLACFSSLLLCTFAASTAAAQGPPAAQPASENARLGPTLERWGVAEGTGSYRLGRWSIVGAVVANPSDIAAELFSTIHFTEDPDLQYGRRIWVPAKARRSTWQFIKLPETLPGNTQLSIRSVVLTGEGREIAQRRSTDQVVDSTLLPLELQNTVTAYLGEPIENAGDDAGYELAAAARFYRAASRKMSIVSGRQMPSVPEAWDTVDQLVVTTDRIANDPAGMVALRQWLHAGGTLWIALDRIRPETVASLLQDEWACHVVDRVGLTEVEVHSVRRDVPRILREYEVPVTLVRLLAKNVRVTHTVDGWPAAMWQDVGRGKVLFTALGAHGWMRHRTPEDPPVDSLNQTAFVLLPHAMSLANEFFGSAPGVTPEAKDDKRASERPAPIVPDVAWQGYIHDQIGYRIPSRVLMASILGIFCVGLVAAGVWLSRSGRLERLALIAPTGAMIVGGVLLGISQTSRSASPPIVAQGQLIEVETGSHEAAVRGLLGVYQVDGGQIELGAAEGGMFFPDLSQLKGTTRRMVWTDLDQWHWENLSLPAGVRTAPFRIAKALDQPLEVQAQLGPNGIHGSVVGGSLGTLEGAIIATRAKRVLEVPLGNDGSFIAGAADVQSRDSFFSATLLSDEQRRRHDVYRRLHAELRRPISPEQAIALAQQPPPLLFVAWAKPLPTGFQFPKSMQTSGSALVVAPLRLEPTPPGTNVLIPAPLLPIQLIGSPDGVSERSSAYDPKTGEWQRRSNKAEAWFRVQLPSTVRNLQVSKATVSIFTTGLASRIELKGWNGTTVESIGLRENDPVGRTDLKIEIPDCLRLDDLGGIVFALAIGRHDPNINSNNELHSWEVEEVLVQIEGRTP